MNKRKVTKRITAWFMCLAMLLTMVNLPAFTTEVKAEEAPKAEDTKVFEVTIDDEEHHLKYDAGLEKYICQDEDCEDQFEPGYYNYYGTCDEWDAVYALLGNLTVGETIEFWWCESLEIVDLGSLTSVKNIIIDGCISLTTVDLGNLTSASEEIQLGICNELTTVDLGNLASVGSYLLISSDALRTLDLGNLTSVGSYLHIECEHLTTLDAGSLTSVGSYIFFYGLFTSVKVHEGDPCNIGSKVGEDKIIVRNHNFSENGTCGCGLTQVEYEVNEGTKTVRITGPNAEIEQIGDFVIPSTVKIDGEDYLNISR